MQVLVPFKRVIDYNVKVLVNPVGTGLEPVSYPTRTLPHSGLSSVTVA